MEHFSVGTRSACSRAVSSRATWFFTFASPLLALSGSSGGIRLPPPRAWPFCWRFRAPRPRLLLKMVPGGYPIYYNGPVVLAFLVLLRPIVPRRDQPRRIILRSELLLGMGCIAVAALNAVSLTADRSDLVQLTTKRGSILSPHKSRPITKPASRSSRKKSWR